MTVTPGFGQTVKRQERAPQKAVRKALGEIVDAETITDKEQVIKDEVITYSDGFVSKTLDANGPEKIWILGLYLDLTGRSGAFKVVERLRK